MITENQQYMETLGAEFSAPDIRDYRIDSSSLQSEFPAEFELPMPPVKNQGSVGSCVAHSIALVAEYFNQQQYGIANEISVGYIYGNRVPPLNKTAGMITRFAISNFCADGAPTFNDFPLHCEVPDIITAVEKAKDSLDALARQFRFTSYIKVSKEKEIKTALMQGYPVIIAVDWYNDMKVKDGVITSNFTQKSGGHAMVLYGWDENGWKIQNSWSVFWGNQGRAVWPYDFKLREAYAIVDTETTPLNIKKPFKTQNKFLRTLVNIANKIYSVFYSLWYRIKH